MSVVFPLHDHNCASAATLLVSMGEPLSPASYLGLLMGSKRTQPKFTPVSDEMVEGYNMEVVNAVRSNDVSALRSLNRSLTVCNRNGESILHLACRRGNAELVDFLLREARVDWSITDDLGRTVFHDVCWRPSPDFQIMKILMEFVDPFFMLQEDRRGHTCFDYCRKEHWSQWTGFLEGQAAFIKKRAILQRECHSHEETPSAAGSLRLTGSPE